MDIKLLLVKSITLLFLESNLADHRESTAKPIVKKALEYINPPESAADTGLERNAIVHLRSTLLWMINSTDSQPYDKNDLLQRIRVNCGQDDKLYDAFIQGLIDIPEQDKLLKQVGRAKRDLQKYLAQQSVKTILKKASSTAAFNSNDIGDWQVFLQKTAADLLSIDMGNDVKQDPAFVGSIDFSKRETVVKAFEEMEDVLSTEGSIKLPFQALNRLHGETMGIRRGEFWLYNALPHSYKSGMLMDIFLGTALFNDPYLFDKTKVPTLLLFSTEDDLPVIIQKMFVILKQIETKYTVAIDWKTWSNDERTDYVIERLTSRGWHVEIHRVMPSSFTIHKYISTLEDYKARGFEIALIVNDYLSMFNKEGCVNDAVGDNYQDLFRRTREYTTANRISHVTAHQLSTDVKELKRQNPEKFIFDLPGKGYYEKCKRLDTEVDGEVYTNKQVLPSGTFLEVLWGKHRKVGATNEKDKYFVLRFAETPLYGIRYDLLEEDSSYRVLGGKANADGGGREWYDLEG